MSEDIDPCAGPPAGGTKQLRPRARPEGRRYSKRDKKDAQDKDSKEDKEGKKDTKDREAKRDTKDKEEKKDTKDKEGKKDTKDKECKQDTKDKRGKKDSKEKKDKGGKKDSGEKKHTEDKQLKEREYENGATASSKRKSSVPKRSRSDEKVKDEVPAHGTRRNALFEEYEELSDEKLERDDITNTILEMEKDYEVSSDLVFGKRDVKKLLSNSKTEKQRAMKLILAFIRPIDEERQLNRDLRR